MKTKLLAALNIFSLLTFTIILEFTDAGYGKGVLIVGIVAFTVSGVFSVFKRAIWNAAHVNYTSQPKVFFIEHSRWVASLCTIIVVVLSILADFVEEGRNLSVFTSYLIVYVTLTLPCHLIIFKREYQSI